MCIVAHVEGGSVSVHRDSAQYKDQAEQGGNVELYQGNY